MNPEQKKQTKAQKKKPIFTIILILIVGIVGYFVFINWQNSQQIIKISNLNTTRLPTSGEREIKRPTLETGQSDWLNIPDRKIEAPIIYIDEVSEDVFQEALARGVVHYPGTALPGEYGNPYIFGHSSDYFWKPGDYKTIFAPLVDIPLDTEVRITDHDGKLFIYRVIETKIVGPKDVSVLDQQDYERKLLSLQASYPIGTALKRYIVICELDEEATYGSGEPTGE